MLFVRIGLDFVTLTFINNPRLNRLASDSVIIADFELVKFDGFIMEKECFLQYKGTFDNKGYVCLIIKSPNKKGYF